MPIGGVQEVVDALRTTQAYKAYRGLYMRSTGILFSSRGSTEPWKLSQPEIEPGVGHLQKLNRFIFLWNSYKFNEVVGLPIFVGIF